MPAPAMIASQQSLPVMANQPAFRILSARNGFKVIGIAARAVAAKVI
jgi:hypothetical protein